MDEEEQTMREMAAEADERDFQALHPPPQKANLKVKKGKPVQGRRVIRLDIKMTEKQLEAQRKRLQKDELDRLSDQQKRAEEFHRKAARDPEMEARYCDSATNWHALTHNEQLWLTTGRFNKKRKDLLEKHKREDEWQQHIRRLPPLGLKKKKEKK